MGRRRGYWLTAGARAKAGIDDQTYEGQDGDLRIPMALQLVAALYDKNLCSFVPPCDESPAIEDCYHFPDGAAFCNEGKVGAAAAASILRMNPRSRLPQACVDKAQRYFQRLAICDVQQPEGFGKDLPKMAALQIISSSSTGKKDEPGLRKRPAADRK